MNSASFLRVLLMLSLSCIGVALKADTIYLKNGKQIHCDSAWEDGKEVRYSISDGTVGIPKSMVAKIEKDPPPPPTPPQTQTRASAQSDATLQQAVQAMVNKTEPATSSAAQTAARYTKEGLDLANSRDLTGALDRFQKAYQTSKDRNTTLNLALIYFALKDDWNAQLYFHEVLSMDSNDAIALDYLGEISWRGEDLHEAAEYWQKSLKIKDNPLIRAKLARSLKEQKASADYENTATRHFLIRYDGGTADSNLVRELTDFLEKECRDLSAQFDFYPSTPIVVVLYPAQQYYNVTDAPVWSGGANDGKIKLPIKGLNSLTDELRGVLTHELTHSFIDLKTSGNCPVWLQEGLAQYSEGKRINPEGNAALSTLITKNQLPSIIKLEGSFRGANRTVAGVLYLESLGFTQFLVERYQFYMINSLLEELSKGVTTAAAFENAYSIPLSQIDANWRHSLSE